MTEAVQPFIPDHGQQFAHHLLGFLASKLSIARYDRLISGEAASPSHAVLPSSPGAPLAIVIGNQLCTCMFLLLICPNAMDTRWFG